MSRSPAGWLSAFGAPRNRKGRGPNAQCATSARRPTGEAATSANADASTASHVDHALRDALAHPKNRASGGQLLPRGSGAGSARGGSENCPAAVRHPTHRPTHPPTSPLRPTGPLLPPAVLRLEAEVEAFVVHSTEPQHIFSGEMSSYEVGAASRLPPVAASACGRRRQHPLVYAPAHTVVCCWQN